jgi:hypothetical protein
VIIADEDWMNRRLTLLLPFLLAAACRNYDLESRLTDQSGLVPADQYARYGNEQAEAVAIAREFGRAAQGRTPEAFAKQADVAMTYARTLPDVKDIGADPLGHRLTIRFASGWRVAVNPVNDGKSGSETPGIAAAPPPR